MVFQGKQHFPPAFNSYPSHKMHNKDASMVCMYVCMCVHELHH